MIELEASAETSVVYEFERFSYENIFLHYSTGTLTDIGIESESSFFFAVHSNTFAATNISVKDGPGKRTCADITDNQSTRASAKNDSSNFEFSKNLNYKKIITFEIGVACIPL